MKPERDRRGSEEQLLAQLHHGRVADLGGGDRLDGFLAGGKRSRACKQGGNGRGNQKAAFMADSKRGRARGAELDCV